MLARDKTYLLKQNEALFEATLNEFSSKPYDIASTNVIIKNSDYNKGSFYYRFKTKEEIYFALIDYVYTKNIALLNADNIKLNNIQKAEELVDLLFLNLKKLWELDKRYYSLLKTISQEPQSIKEFISSNCIESSQTRILTRLEEVLKHASYPYLDILLESLQFLLFHHFSSFEKIDSELNNIKQFLFSKALNAKRNEKPYSLDLSELKGNLNYIITDNEECTFSKHEEFSLSKQLVNKQTTLVMIRKKLKIKQVTLENVIDSGIKKSLRNLNYFLNLKSLKFAKTSYHLLNYSEQIALLLVYNSFIGNEYILLNQLISNYKPNELEILFNLILPKTAKISKIVVVDKTIYPNFLNNFYTYVFKNGSIIEIDSTTLTKESSRYFINYYEGNLLKTKVFNKFDSQLITYLETKKIKNISSDYSLEFKDIEECER